MLTTMGCRVQSTARRKRLERGARWGFRVLAAILLLVIARNGHAEALGPWHGPMAPLPSVTLSGTPLSLDTLRGRAVFVHFFATWCESCGPELRALEQFRARHADRAEIIAIDVGEPRDRLTRFLARYPVTFPVALDERRAIARAWGVYALPSTFILDRSHLPKWSAVGDVDWSDPAIATRLEFITPNPVEADAAPQTRVPASKSP